MVTHANGSTKSRGRGTRRTAAGMPIGPGRYNGAVRVVLEHLTMAVPTPGSIAIVVELEELTGEHDPVTQGFSHHRDALSHSTSWRADGGRLLLTFAHVLPDGTRLDKTWTGSPEDVEALPSACHAIRHLHFLRFTDTDIAATSGLDLFWDFARQTADHHYPAVAGLLNEHGLGDQDFVI